MMTDRTRRGLAAALAALLLLPALAACAQAGQGDTQTSAPAPSSVPAPTGTPAPTPPRYAEGEESMERPLGPLVINELTVADGDSVELKNRSDRAVQLSDYYLSDKNRDRLKLRLPELLLEPGGLYVTQELSLSVKGDRLWLSDAQETVLDYARISEVPVGGSYGRIDGQDGWFYFTSSSLGEDNGEGLRRVSARPEVSLPGGAYDGLADGLSLELSGSGTIYYTLDGQKPSEQSARYQGPIHLTETTVLRAYCVEEGAVPSRVSTWSYFLNEGHSLPILSFSGDDYAVWRNHYYGGRREGEYPGTVALYVDGRELFSRDCGLRLKGYSAVQDEMKKNVGFYFRGRYGDGELENCELFGNGVTTYSSLLLRAGQDHHEALIRNEVMQELCLEASEAVPTQHNLYCVVYMNGQYRGIYSLKENMNEHFFADYFGVSPESVNTLRLRDAVKENDELQELFALGIHADMTDSANYERFCTLFDLDNFVDYALLEGFSGNTDMLDNVRYVKTPEFDARWRFAFFDLDNAFFQYYGGMRCVFGAYSRTNHELTGMARNLARSPAFRDKLFSRYAELLRGPLSPENVTATIERLAAEIEPEIARDRALFDISMPSFRLRMDELRRYGTPDYTRATIEALRETLSMSKEEVEHYFAEWL